MSRFYENPELEIRRYSINDVTYTTSTPETGDNNTDVDLTDDDINNPFQ